MARQHCDWRLVGKFAPAYGALGDLRGRRRWRWRGRHLLIRRRGARARALRVLHICAHLNASIKTSQVKSSQVFLTADTPRDVLQIYRHGTQSQSVSEPSSRGRRRAAERTCGVSRLAHRGPLSTRWARRWTHTRQDGEGRPKQCTLRASRSPGRPRQRSGRRLWERAGIRQESGTSFCGVQASGSPQGSGP